MQPSEEDFTEWLGHPVTEWVMGLMRDRAGEMKGKWADQAWSDGVVDDGALLEARVRADCYLEIPQCVYEDWRAIDDSRD